MENLAANLLRQLNRRLRPDNLPSPAFAGLAKDPAFEAEDLAVLRRIRGENHPPAIILHGVSTRSGTVYATEVLRLHPHTFAFPKDLWEFPLLQTLEQLLPQQENFFNSYRQNKGKIHDLLLLPLLGAAFIHYLYALVPAGKTLLMKVPSVAYLDYFQTMFPFERCVVLMRDGRDVVQSTMATWEGHNFRKLCRDWAARANFLLTMRERLKDDPRFHFVTYEQLHKAPADFAKCVFDRFLMPIDEYPFEQLASLPVRGSSTASTAPDGKVTWAPVQKPENFKALGKWREAWTDQQKQAFKRLAGEPLIGWGYTSDNDW